MITDLTQQHGWKTQDEDDKMTKKCRARLCIPLFLSPWIFQPSCYGGSLLIERTESTMANKNNKRKRKRVRREHNCTWHLTRITSRSLSNFTSPGMVDNFSSGVTVNQISIAKTNVTHTKKNTILHPLLWRESQWPRASERKKPKEITKIYFF